MPSLKLSDPPLTEPAPAWDIARLFQDQGDLTESDYLHLTEYTCRMAEFVQGRIEVLPAPTLEHQRIAYFLMTLLNSFIANRRLGNAVIAPYRVRVGERVYREPDITFVREENIANLGNRFGEKADLVMEVVSEDDRKRDLVDKRHDYAVGGIWEYWIVDPRDKRITVLRLQDGQYVTHSEATLSGQVTSALLDGFTVDVATVFAAGEQR